MSYAYLLNVEPSYLVFLKTYNTEFGEMFITFTDQNRRKSYLKEKVIFVICEKSIQQIWEKIIGYCH